MRADLSGLLHLKFHAQAVIQKDFRTPVAKGVSPMPSSCCTRSTFMEISAGLTTPRFTCSDLYKSYQNA